MAYEENVRHYKTFVYLRARTTESNNGGKAVSTHQAKKKINQMPNAETIRNGKKGHAARERESTILYSCYGDITND